MASSRQDLAGQIPSPRQGPAALRGSIDRPGRDSFAARRSLIDRLSAKTDTPHERQNKGDTPSGRPSIDTQKTDRRVDTQRDPRQTLGIRDRVKSSIENAKDRMEADRERSQARRPGQIAPDRRERQREIVVDRDYHKNKSLEFRCRTAMPTHVVYHDRPYVIPRRDRYVHMYYDTYGYPCHQLVWPTFQFGVCYHHGGDWAWNFVYPFYHRKYVFVSLDGGWPTDYMPLRYYWYGYHPYEWYGYNPVAREVRSDTYNYYTYNYYSTDSTAGTSDPEQTIYGIPVDQLTPRSKENAPLDSSKVPGQPAVADVWFENGVKAFESEQYATAVEEFRQAMASDGGDRIVPFAYSQALFAAGRYQEAAEAVRKALARTSERSQGVFYPRGLYKDDDALYKHIDGLMDQIEKSPSDTDLQLLLGYHLLGIGEADKALDPLQKAGQDPRNVQAVEVLKDLQSKIAKAAEAEKMDKQQTGHTSDVDPMSVD